MADNTTTYKTVVETEVKGAEEVKDLGDKAEETEGKFKSFKTQIRETIVAMQKLEDEGKAVGSEYEKLRAKLDDLNDAQDRAKFKAGQFEDKLASLPGPLGQLGGGLKTMGDSFATFGKTLTVSLGIIGLLVAAFFAIKEAMGKTKEGQENLSKAMSAFNSVVAPLFALLEKVGNAILPIVTKGFEVLGQVMAKVAGFFGASNAKIKEVHTSLEKNNELVQANAEKQKKAAEDLKKQKEEEAKKHAEVLAKKKAADEKAEAERKKKAEEQAKIQAEASKVLTDAYIATLAQRDQELYKAGQAHNERMLALEKAGIKDKTAVLEQYRIETDAINKKYDDEAAKKAEDEKKKKEDEQKKLDEDAKKAAEDKLKAETTAREDAITLEQANFDLKRATNQATFQDQRDLFEKTRELERQNLVANNASQDAILAYDKQTAAMRIQNKKDEEAIKIAAVSQALDAVSSMVDQNSAAGKAISAAQAIINTYQGATAALGAYPPPFNFIAAAAVTAAGLMNVKKILSTQVPSVSGGTVPNTSVGGVAPTAPTMPTINAPQVQTTGGTNPTAQIASTLAASSNKPIKAYVVSGDVSSTQALDRRTNRAATFSAG
jgi:chromosome segregation ATPase